MRVIKWLLVVLLLVMALLAGGVVWVLFSQSGRDWLVAQVNGVTSQLETPIVLGRLEGNPLQDARLQSLTVGDAQGVWLTVDAVRLVWSPLAMLGSGRPFTLLEVAKVDMARMPVPVAPSEVVDDERATPADILSYLRFVPMDLRIADIQLDEPVAGRAYRLAAEIASEGRDQHVRVTTLEGPTTQASGKISLNALDDIAADISLQEMPRGLMGALLKLPQTASISATLAGALQGENVQVDRLDVKAGTLRVQGEGEGFLNGERVSASVVLKVRDLSEFSGLSGMALKGKADARILAQGGMDGVRFAGVVSDTTIDVSGTRVTGLKADVSGTVALREAWPFAVRGTVAGEVSGVGEGVYPVVLQADVSGTREALGVQGRGRMVRGNERVDMSLGAVAVVSPLTVNGAVEMAWEQGKTRFEGQVAGALDPVRAELKTLNVKGPGTLVSGSGVVDMQTYLVDGGATVNIADLGALVKLFGIDLKGRIDANVRAKPVNELQTADANIRIFEVIYGGKRAVLRKPAELAWDGRTGRLSPFVLDFAGGSVQAEGRMSEDLVAASLTLRGIDVGMLAGTDDFGGLIDFTANVSGRPQAPIVVANGNFGGKLGEIPLASDMAATWRGGQVALNANVKSGELSAAAEATVQGGLSLLPFEVGVGPDSALRGRVTADIDLEVFNPLLWNSRSQIEGRVSGSVVLGGVLATPTAEGRFVLRDGEYLQSTSGLCLKNIGAEIVANRDVVEVRNLRSTDGEGGSLNGSGRFGLQGDYALATDLKLDNLRLFCGGLASGNVDGTLGVNGVLGDHTVRGNIVVGPLNVRIPGASRQVDIPSVEVERVSTRTQTSLPVITRLAIVLDAPQEIFVRGRGLDAEFGGRLEVGGTATAPLIHGSLSALRGRYTLLDRSLNLADSNVMFEGPVPPSPYLAIKATTTAQGTAITLNVTGNAAKPQISLSSTPSLPQDEVLALLLFGRKLSNISAFEALKLAQATRVMAGLDSGEPGILDRARETLGVDTLDIGSGEEGTGVTVTTGKYLTDDVYISFQQGAEPEDRLFKTELELRQDVTGNTTVDGAGNQSIGIEWKRDY
ncbi:MAG: hypothetical protein EON60_02620 [Alphaproteobacteria bacterium]|nr:MAG: hypothetical protein EON60_02620 [Alphaproteobacteria bacterium]